MSVLISLIKNMIWFMHHVVSSRINMLKKKPVLFMMLIFGVKLPRKLVIEFWKDIHCMVKLLVK